MAHTQKAEAQKACVTFPGHKLGVVGHRATWKATRISSASAHFLPDLYTNVGHARENCGLCLHMQHTEISTIDYQILKSVFCSEKDLSP